MPHQGCFSSNQQISFRLHDFFSTSDFCRVGSLLPERSRTKKKSCFCERQFSVLLSMELSVVKKSGNLLFSRTVPEDGFAEW